VPKPRLSIAPSVFPCKTVVGAGDGSGWFVFCFSPHTRECLPSPQAVKMGGFFSFLAPARRSALAPFPAETVFSFLLDTYLVCLLFGYSPPPATTLIGQFCLSLKGQDAVAFPLYLRAYPPFPGAVQWLAPPSFPDEQTPIDSRLSPPSTG